MIAAAIDCPHPHGAVAWIYPYVDLDLGIARIEYECGRCDEIYLGAVEVLTADDIAGYRDERRRLALLRDEHPDASADEIFRLLFRDEELLS